MKYETVIGLEVHIQLNTLSKMFCADDAAFGGAPNSHIGVLSLALPGALPRANRAAVERAAKLGLALGCEISKESRFDRKNYFYADLPKGYQITQDAKPVCVGGSVSLPDSGAAIRIHHIHLEEDAGKSNHDQDPHFSLIDLNRAGVPLLELVTEPDFRSAEQVSEFMEILRRLVRWLGISDGNMEEGSLRCDVNISLRPEGQAAYGQRCEVKNMNSMRFARQAIEYEVKRQTAVLQSGGTIEQETRGFDANGGATYSLREKEQAHDYRYFPEPDLPPVRIEVQTLEKWRTEQPPMPWEVEKHLMALGLQPQDARLICQEKATADYLLS
ncbi:MAG: Asp-tRNA(Asn)/Glu-tRNA(Gln) amidotransferase subunit GatB, partial [Saprospiraceae bacterium]|nr:Asp-tRNA(Asn)/Glu-tRNA(Gln) amidotransferase subunit GatB [Saprospiraceae bacterium]